MLRKQQEEEAREAISPDGSGLLIGQFSQNGEAVLYQENMEMSRTLHHALTAVYILQVVPTYVFTVVEKVLNSHT